MISIEYLDVLAINTIVSLILWEINIILFLFLFYCIKKSKYFLNRLIEIFIIFFIAKVDSKW